MWNARTNAREALIAVNMRDTDPDRVLRAGRKQRYLHETVIDYARHIEPKSDKVEEKWAKELLSERVPQRESQHDVGRPNVYGEYESASVHGSVTYRNQPVSLESLLEQWALQNYARVRVVASDPTPQVLNSEIIRYHLSPRAASACLSQLDRCADELDWLPEATGSHGDAGFDYEDLLDGGSPTISADAESGVGD